MEKTAFDNRYHGYLNVIENYLNGLFVHCLLYTYTAISGVVPVVGGIIAEASETVLAGASVLKGTIGVFGLLGVLALCAYPFLQLGIQYLLYQLIRFLASVIGSPELCAVIKGLGGAFGLILGLSLIHI